VRGFGSEQCQQAHIQAAAQRLSLPPGVEEWRPKPIASLTDARTSRGQRVTVEWA